MIKNDSLQFTFQRTVYVCEEAFDDKLNDKGKERSVVICKLWGKDDAIGRSGD